MADNIFSAPPEGDLFDRLSDEQKDAALDCMLERIAASNSELLNPQNDNNLIPEIVHSGAPHAANIFVRHAQKGNGADLVPAIRNCLAQRASEPVTVGTLIHAARKCGANLEPWSRLVLETSLEQHSLLKGDAPKVEPKPDGDETLKGVTADSSNPKPSLNADQNPAPKEAEECFSVDESPHEPDHDEAEQCAPAGEPETSHPIPVPSAQRHERFLQLARRYIIPATNKAEGLRLCFDAEANGLLDTASKLHCIVIIDLDSDQTYIYGPGQINDALVHLSRADYLIGHNITNYDLSLFRRLHDWTPPQGCTIVDTLIASRLILPHMPELDQQATAMGDPPLGELAGRHRLEAWGLRLGIPKVGADIEVFSEWTPEIQARCVGDTRLTKTVWQFLQPDGQAAEALALEHRVVSVCDEITTTGIPFDAEAAEQRRKQWTDRLAALEARLCEQFPQVKNWNSRKQIAELLESRGWVPEKRTEKTGQAKIDDEALESVIALYPEFDGLLEHFVLRRRLAQLSEGKEAWLKHIGPDGRIHGGIIHIGTPHSRASHVHPNIAQVPNPKRGKPLATECRELFRANNNWMFVSCDQAGLQDRAFAHLLAAFDGGVYAKAFVAGLDPHWKTAQALELVPTKTVRDKENKLHAVLREGCKSWRYGFLFGMRAERAGRSIHAIIKAAMQVDPTCDLMQRFFGADTPNTAASKRVGTKALNKFIAATPGLGQLRANLAARALSGWLPGLDGRRVPVPAQYKALNYAVTSAEAVICKRWLVNVHDELYARFRYGWDGDVVVVAWIHDELVCCCRPEIADQVGEIMVRYAKEAGEHYSFKVPLDAGYIIGRSWAGDPINESNETAPEPPNAEPAATPKAPAQPPAGKAPPINDVAQARFDNEISLKDVVGEPLVSGKVHCPFHDDTNPSCHIYDDHYHCFACGAHGDAIDWLREVEGLSFRAAQDALASWEPREHPAATREDDGKTLAQAQVLWDEAKPIAGTLAIDYLAFRQIDVDQLTGSPEASLRFHPSCPFGAARVPCLLALYRDIDTDDFAGIHRIALTPNAFTHVPGAVQRRMLGRWMRRRAVKLWPAQRGLVQGEGLETTLAAATRITYRGHFLRPAWAMLSAGAIANCGPIAGVEFVVLLADNEPVGQQATRTAAQRLSANSSKVAVLTPKAVKDFNDLVRARAGT